MLVTVMLIALAGKCCFFMISLTGLGTSVALRLQTSSELTVRSVVVA
jgi:hypothetical protein